MKQKNIKKELLTLLKTLSLAFLLLSFSSILFSIFDVDLEKIDKSNKIILMLTSDITFLIIIFFAYKKKIIEDFKSFFNKNFANNIETSFKYWLIGFIAMIVSNLIIIAFTNAGLANNEETVRALIDNYPMYMIFSVVLYAPFTEELIFRHGFREVFKSKYLYIFISGFVFGSLHVISSLDSISSLLHLIPYCALGFTFASLYVKTNNIFSSISMHMLHNTLAIVVYLIGSVL